MSIHDRPGFGDGYYYVDPVDWKKLALAAESRATKAEAERDALQRDMTFAAAVYRNTLATMVQRESYQMREQERDRAREALAHVRDEAETWRCERDAAREALRWLYEFRPLDATLSPAEHRAWDAARRVLS